MAAPDIVKTITSGVARDDNVKTTFPFQWLQWQYIIILHGKNRFLLFYVSSISTLISQAIFQIMQFSIWIVSCQH